MFLLGGKKNNFMKSGRVPHWYNRSNR